MKILLPLAGILTPAIAFSNTQYFDNYTEAARLFGVANNNRAIDKDLNQRRKAPYYFRAGHKAYATPGFSYDCTDKQNGDFSICFRPNSKDATDTFGFMMNLWEHYPDISPADEIVFELKTHGSSQDHDRGEVELLDADGNAAIGRITGLQTAGRVENNTLTAQHAPACGQL